jgi:hypothetical protein
MNWAKRPLDWWGIRSQPFTGKLNRMFLPNTVG